MKKLFSALMCLVFVIYLLPLAAAPARAETEGEWEYSVADGEATITWYNAEDPTDVNIPSRLGDYPVTGIGDRAFQGCRYLTSVTIPNSVTSIGDGAFEDCSNLTSVTIPNSVTSIGDSAFYGCGLTSVTIPNSITSIGEQTFRGCRSLTSVTIPNSVTSIGNFAFDYCSSLTSVTIPGSVTSIGNWAFRDCSSLTSVTIPNSVISIGGASFYCCRSLTSVTIPNSVTSIGDLAFGDCSSLTSVTIPGSVTSIGTGAFRNCSRLTNVTIPNSVTSIGNATFESCSLTNVMIPDSVTSIGDDAFRFCRSLTSVTIPRSVTSIGANAFYSSGVTDIWYGGSEAQWDIIIRQLNNYWVLTANVTVHFNSVIPTPANTIIPKDQYCIQVVDENGVPVENASVTWRDDAATSKRYTDSQGYAVFSLGTVGTPTIEVKKSGYITWTNANSNWTKSRDRFETVILYPVDAGEYKLASARYSNYGNMSLSTDLLTRTKKLNLPNDGHLIGDLDDGVFYLSCSTVSANGVSRYELWQGNNRIAQCGDGSFGQLSVRSFSKGGGCFIRVMTTDGRQVDTHINLEFAENTVIKTTEISLSSKKITFSVGEDVPYIGGIGELSFDFPSTWKVMPAGKMTHDGKKQYGINLKLKSGETVDEQIQKTKELFNKLDKVKGLHGGKPSLHDAMTFKSLVEDSNQATFLGKDWLTIDAIGYLEADAGSSTLKGELMFAFTIKVMKLEYTAWVVVVPVTAQVKLECAFSTIFEVSYDQENATLLGNLDLEIKPKLTAFGGVGISVVVGVGAYGEAELKTTLHLLMPPVYCKNVDLTGELGLKAYLGPFVYERAFAHNTWHIYTGNNVRSIGLMAAAPGWEEELQEASAYNIEDLGYLMEESDWLGEPVRALRGATSGGAKTQFSSLLTDTYRNAQPVMISDGSALYAAFIRADQQSGSRYAVVTKYNGTSWAQPVRADEAAILDCAPTLCVDNNGTIWMAYAKTVSDPGSSLVSYAQAQQIVVGTVDPSTLTFTAVKTYGGSGFVHLQKLAMLNGQPVLMWADTGLTDENSVLVPAGGTICYARCQGGIWGNSTSLAAVTGSIDSVTPGLQGNSIAAAYLSDGALYITSGSQTNLLAEEINGRVSFGTLPGTDEAAFIWNATDSLNASTGVSVSAEGITHEYAVVGNRIYFSTPTEESANLAVLQYEDGNWSLPMLLTGDSRYLENLSAASLNGDDFIIGMHTAVTITEDSVVDAKNLVWSKVVPVSDLQLDSVDYEPGGLTAGESVPVTLTVVNAGDHTVENIVIELDGEQICTKSLNLLPGQSGEITLSDALICPTALTEKTFRVIESGETDYTPEDNEYVFAIGYADAALELDYQQIGTSKALAATVTNQGVETASGTVVFYDTDGAPVAARSFDNLAAGDVAVAMCELDEGFTELGNGDVSVVVILEQEELNTFNNSASMHILGEYTVTFDANGGEGTMSAQTVDQDLSVTLTENGFTRSGHCFAGWNTNPDGSGTAYADGASVTLTGDLLLYAQWRPDLNIHYTSKTINVGMSFQFAATGGTGNYTWRVGNTSTAMVDSTGKVTGLVAGNTYLYCKDSSGAEVKCLLKITVGLLSIRYSEKTVNVGASFQFTVTGGTGGYTWRVGNAATALVDSTGKVTGKTVGNTYLYCKDSAGTEVKCLLKVVDVPLSIRYSEKTVAVGASFQFTATGGTESYTWRTGNNSIATVSSTGKVTGKAAGNTYLYCKDSAGTEVKCLLKVVVPPSIRYSEKTINVGASFQFEATGGTGDYTWRVGNAAIATVDAVGKVTGKAAGNTYLYCRDDMGNEVKCLLKITVEPLSIRYSEKTVNVGASFQFTATGGTGGYTWRVGNAAIATVDSTGKATGKSTGNTYLYCKDSAGMEVKCLLKITAAPLSIRYAEKTVTVGVPFQFTATGGTGGNTWRVGDTAKATVDSTGKVTGKTAGNTYLYCKDSAGTEVKCLLKVVVPPSIRYSEKTINVGASFQFEATGGTGDYTWRVGNAAIATVDTTGKVTGKAAGNTYLYCRDDLGNEVKCLLKIK